MGTVRGYTVALLCRLAAMLHVCVVGYGTVVQGTAPEKGQQVFNNEFSVTQYTRASSLGVRYSRATQCVDYMNGH